MDKIGCSDLGIAGKSFTFQGFGNVGYWTAKFVEQDGGKVTTIVEWDCAIHKEDGFNVEHVKDYLRKNKSLIGYEDCDETELKDPTKFMEKKVDFLVPAATEKSIHIQNANNI